MPRWFSLLFAALLATACTAEPIDQQTAELYVDHARAEWAETVGVERSDLDVRVVDYQDRALDVHEDHACGAADCRGSVARVELYRDCFAPARDARAIVRWTVLHELVHAHTTCSDRDHSPNPGELMHPDWSGSNLDATVPPATIALIREAWIR